MGRIRFILQMEKEGLKIYFTDYPRGFDTQDNLFLSLLRKRYDVVFSDSPDLLFYGNYGNDYLRFKCPRVLFSSENKAADFRLCDFSFTYQYGLGPRNYRLPLYVFYGLQNLTGPKRIEDIVKQKTRFCNFIYSNAKATDRIRFFKLLNEYKKVDSAGLVMNNMGTRIPKTPELKIQFLREYKFTIAFENESVDGYTTEKIIQPMLVNSLPIYWGSPSVNSEFNARSFVNVMAYPNFEAAVEEVVRIDRDEHRYRAYLQEPFLIKNRIPEQFQETNLLRQLEWIVAESRIIKPVGKRIHGKVWGIRERMKPYVQKGLRFLGA